VDILTGDEDSMPLVICYFFYHDGTLCLRKSWLHFLQ